MPIADNVETCPRCLRRREPGERAAYCTRCGLPEGAVKTTIWTAEPGHRVEVGRLLRHGEICNVYHCLLDPGRQTALIKIARSHMANRFVQSEIETLQRLEQGDAQVRFAPFFPRVLASAVFKTPIEPDRRGVILAYHREIRGADELVSLETVREVYPRGIDARDMAWMWRRLLTALGFVHQQGMMHCRVTPDHVMIEPATHKLALIGWAGAVAAGHVTQLKPLRWKNWQRAAGPATPRDDLASAGQTMGYLLAPGADPAILRHLERAAESSDAWKLLEDFDRLIEALWGPRVFRPFAVLPLRYWASVPSVSSPAE